MAHGDDEPLPTPFVVDQVSWRDLDKNRFYISQFCVFMLIRALLYPANVIKTHMASLLHRHFVSCPDTPTRSQQVAKNLKGTASQNVSGVLRNVVRDKGVSGLWRGFWTVAIGIVPSQMVGELIVSMNGSVDLGFRSISHPTR
jgi:solute carrier family 25 protein 44